MARIIIDYLNKFGFTLTTAESCTGGLLAGRILDIAGASVVYEEGYITYSNESKTRLISVEKATLEKWGAVSKETAIEMAVGAALKVNADMSIVTTGIAGPSGGSIEKPVGLVYIAVYLLGDVVCGKYQFTGDRAEVRAQAVEAAIKLGTKCIVDKQ